MWSLCRKSERKRKIMWQRQRRFKREMHINFNPLLKTLSFFFCRSQQPPLSTQPPPFPFLPFTSLTLPSGLKYTHFFITTSPFLYNSSLLSIFLSTNISLLLCLFSATHTPRSSCGCSLSGGPLWFPSVSIRAPELQPGSIEQGRTQSPLPRTMPAWPGQQRASIPCLKEQKQQAQERFSARQLTPNTLNLSVCLSLSISFSPTLSTHTHTHTYQATTHTHTINKHNHDQLYLIHTNMIIHTAKIITDTQFRRTYTPLD